MMMIWHIYGTKNSPQGCQKWKQFWNMPSQSKDIAFSHLFVLLLVTKWWKIELSKCYIFWVDRHISKMFLLLTSLWWLLSETIIRYPFILRTKFGENFEETFSYQKFQNLKNKKKTFFGMVSSILFKNFKWIVLKLKKTNEGERFWYAHHGKVP